MKLCFLLNKKYCPLSPKWLHHKFKKLPELSSDIEPYQHKASEEVDHDSKIGHVNKASDIIVEFMSSRGRCTFYPAESFYFRGNAKYDFQKSAKEILDKIEGVIKKITLNSIPLGAIDQWINKEDFLMYAAQLKSAKNMYLAKRKNSDQIGDSMV